MPRGRTGHVDDVAVAQELARTAVGERADLLGPLPAQLEHRAEGGRVGARDRPRCEHVARAHVAAGHAVVDELLLARPVPARRYSPEMVRMTPRTCGRGGGQGEGMTIAYAYYGRSKCSTYM